MKKFSKLTKEQKQAAIDKATDELLQAVVEGAISFNDGLNGDHLQKRINMAMDQADKMRTPWFAGEYVMDAVGDELRGMALCTAEDALYVEPGELVVSGIIK